MPCASDKIIIAEVSDDANSKWECECFKYFSWCKLNLIQGKTHAGVLLKVDVSYGENLALFTVTSIHSLWKSTKNKNSETR